MLFVGSLAIAVTLLIAAPDWPPAGGAVRSDEVAHGGGCRKASPPGKYCHMERSTGRVHCD